MEGMKYPLFATVCCAALFGADPVTGTWTGLGADANWATTGNWVSATVPGINGTSDTANMSGAAQTTINVAAPRTLGTLNLQLSFVCLEKL